MRILAVGVLLCTLTGCPKDQPAVQCKISADCNQFAGGSCDPNPETGNLWCSYPDSSCPNGRRWTETDTGDGIGGTCQLSPDAPITSADASPSDGQVDAAVVDAAVVDAALLPAYDIAYPTEWTFSVSGPATAFILIVNTGPSPLSLSTFQVTSVSDNHPDATVRVTAGNGTNSVLQPHTAGGELSGLSQNLLLGTGLVTEQWVDKTSRLLSIELLNAPAGTYDIAVSITVSLDGREVAIPTKIHHVPGPIIYLDPQVGRRVSVFR